MFDIGAISSSVGLLLPLLSSIFTDHLLSQKALSYPLLLISCFFLIILSGQILIKDNLIKTNNHFHELFYDNDPANIPEALINPTFSTIHFSSIWLN